MVGRAPGPGGRARGRGRIGAWQPPTGGAPVRDLAGDAACAGGREVGLFWRDALDWPLVWDEGEETAIQSPRGGTKIAWGGQSDTPGRDRGTPFFDLAATDVRAEAARLLALGATLLVERDHEVELTDPGGGRFRIRSVRRDFHADSASA